MRQSNKTQKFHCLLLRWYSANKRPLPWRRTRDPYRILVSEIMLQQTHVSRVQQKYPQFLKRFPTLQSLANSHTADVIRAWQGMGHNKRALRLRDFAREVVQKYNCRIPKEVNVLLSLPGIGKYTAHALACFAFSERVPVVDVNVSRVLSRVFWRMKSTHDRKDDRTIWKLAQRILPRIKSYEWNQALMDLGATVCISRRPLCSVCPISSVCASQEFLSQVNGKPQSRRTRHEKLYDGFPLRIYRGRIVEQLRKLNNKGKINAVSLGELIKPNFSRTERSWLRSLLNNLEEDGLVELHQRGNTTFVSLPQT